MCENKEVRWKEKEGMPPIPPSHHACDSHTTIILLPSYPPPPNSKSCMKPSYRMLSPTLPPILPEYSHPFFHLSPRTASDPHSRQTADDELFKLVLQYMGDHKSKVCIDYNWCMQCFHTLAHFYVWQSRIEIEYYCIAYFVRITEFDVL